MGAGLPPQGTFSKARVLPRRGETGGTRTEGVRARCARTEGRTGGRGRRDTPGRAQERVGGYKWQPGTEGFSEGAHFV